MIFPNKIIKSSRNTISISITTNGEVILRIPKYVSNDRAMKFLNEKQKWIENKIKENNDNKNKFSEILEYKSAIFLGKVYPIVLVKCNENNVTIKENKLVIFSKSNTSNIKRLLKDFYISVVNDIMLPRIQKISEVLDVDFDAIRYINSKCKWGMCDSNKIVYFNYKLMLLPIEIVDYVILHELTHLKQLNHSKEFWNIIQKIMPKYKTFYNDIKKYGMLLKLF